MRTVVVVLSMVLVLAGLAPLVDAQDTRTVTGTVTRVNRDNHTVHVRPDGGGAELTIVTRNFADTEKSIRAGDRVTATVRDDPAHKSEKWVVAQSISRAGSSSASSSSSSNGWQQIHGVVREVQGSTLTLRADDGRRLTVDMSKVGTEIQRNLQRGDRVTVAAHEVSGNQVRAEFIQKNSSASGSPSASPSSKSVDEKDWQRIHGTVENVRGSRLTLKADDGRTLDVDMRDVSPEIRRALTQGEKVTVAGFYRGDDDRKVTARFIQQDSSKK